MTSELHHLLQQHMARCHHSLPEIEEEKDIAIGAFAHAEAEEELDFASDTSDDDYRLPVPDLPPR